jgi:hypothetical protein
MVLYCTVRSAFRFRLAGGPRWRLQYLLEKFRMPDQNVEEISTAISHPTVWALPTDAVDLGSDEGGVGND